MKTNPEFLYVIYCLVCYRLTRLITTDQVLYWLRAWIGKHVETELIQTNGYGNVIATKTGPSPKVNRAWTWLFDLINCSWCVSFWVGLAIAINFYRDKGWLMMLGYALALSATSGIMSEKV